MRCARRVTRSDCVDADFEGIEAFSRQLRDQNLCLRRQFFAELRAEDEERRRLVRRQ